MKNEFDDKYIANEVKKYIDNIQVPEELGGMIMKKVNNENESSNKIKSGKKVKKIVAIAASLVIVFGVGTFAAIKCNLFSKESQTINNIEQSQMATGKEEKIDNNVVNIDNIVGEWKPYKAVDKNNKEVSLKVVYGSSYKAETDALKIKEDGTYTYYIGASMGDGSEEGTYTIINNESFKLVSKTLLKDWIYQGVHAGVALLEGVTDIAKVKALIKAASKGLKEVITKSGKKNKDGSWTENTIRELFKD